jgi:hypothetical protein
VTTANVDVGKDLNVTGNLNVLGTRTIVDTDTLRVKDPIIELGKDNPGTGDLGLVMSRPSGSSNVAMIFDESTDTLEIGYTQSNASDTDITMRTAATEPLDVNVNGNVSVGKDLTVTGNVAVDTDTFFVDSVNDRVGIGTTDPLHTLHIRGDNCRLVIADSSEDDADTNAFNCGIAFVDNTHDGTTTYTGNPEAGMGFFLGHLSSSSKEVNMKNLTGPLSFGTRNTNKAMYINNDGNVGIGTTTPSAPLDVPGGIASPGFQAQYGLTCAGLVTWTGSYLSWDHRIIAIPVEKNEFGASGHLDMYVPASGTTITYYNVNNTISTTTTTADGFPIDSWEALWYVVTPGQSNPTVNSQYVITNYVNSLWKPNSNWLLLAVRNGDTSYQDYLKFIPTNGNYYTWKTPAWGTNWGNYGGSYNTGGYYKDGDGIVHLKGLVTGGSYGSSATLFTLPAGFRPGGRCLFTIITDNAHGRLDIKTTGQVIPYVGSGWLSLDGISFKAEQ